MLTAMMSCFCDPHPHLAFLVSCPVLVPCPVSSPISSQQNYTHTHTHTSHTLSCSILPRTAISRSNTLPRMHTLRGCSFAVVRIDLDPSMSHA